MNFLIVAFDLEGTLINAELFPALGRRLGTEPILDDITDRAMRGELDFRDSLEMRLKLIHGVNINTVREVADSLSLSEGALETINEVKHLGGTPVIITGGFDILAERVAGLLGIEYVCCNHFEVKEGRINGVMEPVVTGVGKAEKLLGLASWLGVDPKRCIAVGDGANDIQMMEATGLSIAYNGREKVCRTATVVVNGGDLRCILPYIREFAASGARREVLVNPI